jgi:hypothetical protein
VLLLAAVALAAEPAVLTADRVVWSGGVATAVGSVEVMAGDDRVVGETATWTDDRITVHQGTWSREGVGDVTFERAEVDLKTRGGTLDAAVIRTGSQRAAGEFTWTERDTLKGTAVTWTPCACDGRSAWGVSAQRIELSPGEWVAFGPGFIRVLDVPVIPVPGGKLPLSRRSGLLWPRVGTGEDGVVVAQPLYLTLGRSADVTLTPELRTKRSERMLTETRYAMRGGTGQLIAVGGRDRLTKTPRAAASWTHQWASGDWWAATQGALTTDTTYAQDYGDSFLDRMLPVRETRALIGHAFVELTANAFQSATDTRQELAGLRIRPRLLDLPGGVVATADVRARAIRGAGYSGGAGLSTGHLGLFATAERPTLAGPILINPAAALFSRTITAAPHGGRWSWGAASLDVGVPAWRAGTAFERLEPIVQVGAVADLGVPWDGALDHLPPTGPVWASAGLGYRRTGRGLLELSSTVRATPDALTTHLDGTVRSGPFSLSSQLEGLEELQLGAVTAGLRPKHLALDVAWVWLSAQRAQTAEPLHQLRTAGTLDLGTWQVGGGLLTDVRGAFPLSRTARLGWRHPTGCVALAVDARFDADRDLPDTGLSVDINPAPRSR